VIFFSKSQLSTLLVPTLWQSYWTAANMAHSKAVDLGARRNNPHYSDYPLRSYL